MVSIERRIKTTPIDLSDDRLSSRATGQKRMSLLLSFDAVFEYEEDRARVPAHPLASLFDGVCVETEEGSCALLRVVELLITTYQEVNDQH